MTTSTAKLKGADLQGDSRFLKGILKKKFCILIGDFVRKWKKKIYNLTYQNNKYCRLDDK